MTEAKLALKAESLISLATVGPTLVELEMVK